MNPFLWRSLLLTSPAAVVLMAMLGITSLILSFVPKGGAAQYAFSRWCARMLLRVGGVRVKAEGLEELNPGAVYVFASNHASLMDPPVLTAHLPIQFRYLAKKELFRVPFLGMHLRSSGHLAVDRSDARAGLRSMSDAARTMRDKGISVLVFPEGSRTGGELKDFKEGAAYIALKAGLPVVPVALSGTHQILSPGRLLIRPGEVLLRVAEPISTLGMTLKDRARLTELLHRRVADLMAGPPEEASAI
ncbi:MAG: lysophospholipid acyltransferase family protein [Bryobacteraceae bacterium]